MKEFTIDRSKWLCGKLNDDNTFGTEMFAPDADRMCCLGHLALSCGIKKIDLVKKSKPSNLKKKLPSELKFLVKQHTDTDESDFKPDAREDLYMYINEIKDK